MIVRKSLADVVAEKIKGQIVSGHYKPNDKLPIEPELMRRFNVGRSTVREAVKQLANSGYLRVQQGLGTFVQDISIRKTALEKDFSKADMEEVDEVRRLLEMKIAEKAASNRSEEDLSLMKLHLNDRLNHALSGDLEKCVAADIAFHTSVAIAAKNKILLELYSTAAKHLGKWFLNEYPNTSSFKDTQDLHENLLQAIADKNQQEAWSIAEAIIKWH